MQKLLKKTEAELRLKNYSPRTVKSYVGCLRAYFIYKKSDFVTQDSENIKAFLLSKQDQGCSGQTINVYLQAIKFFYNHIIKSSDPIAFPVSKKRKRLPTIFSRKEIQLILNVTSNLKHNLLLATAYGSGLRVSEVLNLKVKDISAGQLTVHVRQGKGNKDRVTVLAKTVAVKMKDYLQEKSSNDYVFLSNRGGKLSTRSAQKILQQACHKAGIKKEATFHSLRHSFATHLIENGTDIRYIQELLGHRNIRTTQMYTKVTNPALKNIISPL